LEQEKRPCFRWVRDSPDFPALWDIGRRTRNPGAVIDIAARPAIWSFRDEGADSELDGKDRRFARKRKFLCIINFFIIITIPFDKAFNTLRPVV
jgi:hypothetical protein